jgi:hypothetical protein
MNGNTENKISKFDPQQFNQLLQVDLSGLPEEKKQELLAKLMEQRVDLQNEANKRLIKSSNAAHDLAMMTDKVKDLDNSGKTYVFDEKLETGSGALHVKIRGGDTKFVIPILIVLGCIILGLALIFAGS